MVVPEDYQNAFRWGEEHFWTVTFKDKVKMLGLDVEIGWADIDNYDGSSYMHIYPDKSIVHLTADKNGKTFTNTDPNNNQQIPKEFLVRPVGSMTMNSKIALQEFERYCSTCEWHKSTSCIDRCRIYYAIDALKKLIYRQQT